MQSTHDTFFSDALSQRLIGCAITVHKTLGPGLLENTYEQCLAQELRLESIPFEQQVPVKVQYKGITVECGYRMDMLVDKKIIVELKSVEKLLPIHAAQLMTYLRLSNLRHGFLINFNVTLLKNGLRSLIL